MIHPGAQMELYTGGDGQPHVRLVGVETGKVKILDKYLIESTSKGTAAVEPEVKSKGTISSQKAEAIGFKKSFEAGGAQVISDLPDAQEGKLMDGLAGHGRIIDVKVIGESGLATVTLEDGRSALVHPSLDSKGVWHLQSTDSVPDVKTAAAASASAAESTKIRVSTSETSFAKSGTVVDKAHLADVLSGKGHPETTMAKGGAGAVEATGGKGGAGAETSEAKPAVWDAQLTKAEIAEYKGVVKGVRELLVNDVMEVYNKPYNIIDNSSDLTKFAVKDIDRVINEAIKDIGKGSVSFDLGNALEPGQSMALEDKLALVQGNVHDVLVSKLSPELQLLVSSPNSEYSMLASAWGDSNTPVFVAPGGSHLMAVELPGNRWQIFYDPAAKFYADGPGEALIMEKAGSDAVAIALEPDLSNGKFTINPVTS